MNLSRWLGKVRLKVLCAPGDFSRKVLNRNYSQATKDILRFSQQEPVLSSLGAITALIFAGRTDPKLSLRGVHMSVRMSVCVCVCVCVLSLIHI